MVVVTIQNSIVETVSSTNSENAVITRTDPTMKLTIEKNVNKNQQTSKNEYDVDDENVTLRVKSPSDTETKNLKYVKPYPTKLPLSGKCFSDGDDNDEDIDRFQSLLDGDDFPDEIWHFQRDSFIHRSYNEKLLARKNANDYPKRPVSVPNDATFKRDSFLRQSLKSIRNSFNKSIRKKNYVTRGRIEDEDSNNNSDKSGGKSDRVILIEKGLLIENVLNLPIQSCKDGHSRTSSSSSLTSNRSTNSVSLGFRSAPTTPMAPLQSQNDGHVQSAVNLNSLSRSPSHLSAKIDSKSVRHLSTVPPATASNARSPSPHPTKSSKNDIQEKKRKELSSGRQKKFHRHFQQVDVDERVINYFSCALVSDILLQGHLYITDNYFAFYSNVFGFVTKLLIPIVSVVKISKEKTAKIIPNAVGVATADERHVFGSFMSREAAYRLMLSVWRPVAPVEPEVVAKIPDVEISECSIEDDSSSAISGNESPPRLQESTTSDASQTIRHRILPSLIDGTPNGIRPFVSNVIEGNNNDSLSPNSNQLPLPSRSTSPPPKIVIPRKFFSFPLQLNMLYVGLVLTILLALLSGFLLYRIMNIQTRSSHYDPLDFKWKSANQDMDVYSEVVKWQKEMQSKSVDEAQIVLNSNLEKIARVRKSLETLSVLIHNKNAPSLTDYSYMSSSQDAPLDGTTFDRSKT